ncbi:large ribosomal subunit protein eL13z-like [Pyrus communis]|uniref:large ribosomal subunit protein eL13z-like n=1 Tax=Pyrus communis TaxID=23211 RepID=UPI0035C096D6
MLGFQRNLNQPLEFMLIIVGRIVLSRVFKLQADDSLAKEIANATQLQGPYLPIAREKPTVELVKVTNELKSFKAYDKLRVEKMNTRHIGARLKKAAKAEKEEKK